MSKNPKAALNNQKSPVRRRAFERPGLTEDEIEEIRDSTEFKELSKRIPNFTQKCKNTLMIDYFIDKYPKEELLKKLKSNTTIT